MTDNIQINMLVMHIITQVPINNNETNPPNIDAKKPVVLYRNINNKMIATNPNGINLKTNFANFTHK